MAKNTSTLNKVCNVQCPMSIPYSRLSVGIQQRDSTGAKQKEGGLGRNACHLRPRCSTQPPSFFPCFTVLLRHCLPTEWLEQATVAITMLRVARTGVGEGKCLNPFKNLEFPSEGQRRHTCNFGPHFLFFCG